MDNIRHKEDTILTTILLSLPATTPYPETVINNPTQALSFLSNADLTNTHESETRKKEKKNQEVKLLLLTFLIQFNETMIC